MSDDGGEERQRDMYAALTCVPVSDEALRLVEVLAKGLTARERQGRKHARGQGSQDRWKFAIGALVGDLLWSQRSETHQGWVYRSRKSKAFSRGKVSYRTFVPLIDTMIAVGALTEHEYNSKDGDRSSAAARYKASDWLLRQCEAQGITPGNINRHLVYPLPEEPLLRLTRTKRAGKDKVQGKPMEFDRTPEVLDLERDIIRLNGFLDGFALENAEHRGYLRIFNNGDDEGFAWDQGGRLYSQGKPSYQSIPGAERKLMRIDGAPVVEIDIRASYLTLLYGLTGNAFDVSADPYDLEGLLTAKPDAAVRRWVAKQYAVVCLGNGKIPRRWPSDIADEFRENTGEELDQLYPVTVVTKAMAAKHPLLADWQGHGLSWGDLMFHESRAMLGAMLRLMDDHGIPSFSVHDSLIVRAQDEAMAREALEESYRSVCGIIPHISV